uniref:XRN2-binding (XTBD) domain-containing protein n=1 Tax=Petromyzon marinus TaxID=7757 RepID=S4RBE8_PETMA
MEQSLETMLREKRQASTGAGRPDLESLRGAAETDKQWRARREFLSRHADAFPAEELDHLVSLSMVWANNVFMGCRYSAELMERVGEMAAGVHVEDAPIFTTRDEIMAKQKGR